MAGYMGAKYGSGSYGINPEDNDYLYGESQQYQGENALGGQDMASDLGESGGTEGADMAAAAGTGALMGGPVGAGVMVGSKFLTQYLANKAAEERARRQNAVKIAQDYGNAQNRSLSELNQTYSRALR